jgi:predicted extracellular nuclease
MHKTLLLLTTTLAACGNGGSGTPITNPPPPPGNSGITAIYDVQGSGASSPLVGQLITIEGIVTGDFQDNDADVTRNLGGFYLQGVPDADLATSDGIFVFDGNNPPVEVNPGDAVRVQGIVNENFGETQISSSSVSVTGTGEILPISVTLPAASTTVNSDGELIADLERYEGMLVHFPQTLTVSQLRHLERFGQLLISEGGRQYAYTNQNLPDVAGYRAHSESIAARRIILDDGRGTNNAKPVPYLNASEIADYSIRLGDEVAGLTGVLRYSRGSGPAGTETYRLMPTIEPLFESVNTRESAITVDGALRISSFNLNNFFSTIDAGQDNCGPSGVLNCRGANSAQELQRQLIKIVNALVIIDADIFGLVELENNADESLQSLVNALNAAIGSATYAYVDTGTIGDDAIKVGILYKTATVMSRGDFAILDSSADSRFDDSRNRPVLVQTFEQVSSGEVLTVAVNHLKSKGSSCESIGDPDLQDGQDDCSKTRTAAVSAMIDWLATDPTASGDTDVLVIGDPNAHSHDDAMRTFKDAGYEDLADAHIGNESYSFEFDGQSGALDHALASPSLAQQVTAVIEWHINADEPRVLNYDLEFARDPGLFDATTPYRGSDHDPLIIGLDLTQ